MGRCLNCGAELSGPFCAACGQRARYLPPVRLYLLVSFFYFVISAAAPEQAAQPPGQVSGPGGIRIGITNSAAVIVVVTFVVYALASARAVFGGGWPITIVKAAGIGFVYLLASMPAFLIMLLWASLT